MGPQGLQQQEPDNEKVINCRLGYEAEPTQTLLQLLREDGLGVIVHPLDDHEMKQIGLVVPRHHQLRFLKVEAPAPPSPASSAAQCRGEQRVAVHRYTQRGSGDHGLTPSDPAEVLHFQAELVTFQNREVGPRILVAALLAERSQGIGNTVLHEAHDGIVDDGSAVGILAERHRRGQANVLNRLARKEESLYHDQVVVPWVERIVTPSQNQCAHTKGYMPFRHAANSHLHLLAASH